MAWWSWPDELFLLSYVSLQSIKVSQQVAAEVAAAAAADSLVDEGRKA